MKVAALQFAPLRAQPDSNMETLGSLLADVEADLLVLPELASTGYFFTSVDELRPLAEAPETGDFCRWVRTLAAERGMIVVAGFAEASSDGRLFNSAITALPDGRF